MTGDEYMSIWDLIPTCDDPMSCYTLCALTVIVSGGFLTVTILIYWISNEFRRLDKNMDKLECAIDGHNGYIDDTTEVINKIQIELAVQESSMETLKKDIAEIKTDVKTLLKR